MEKNSTETSISKNRNTNYGIAWIVFGLLSMIIDFCHQRYFLNSTVEVFIAIGAGLLLIILFFSLADFYPESKFKDCIISIGIIAAIIEVLTPIRANGDISYLKGITSITAYALLIIISAIFIGRIIKEGLWALWIPMVIGLLVRVAAVFNRDYIVSDVVFQILFSLVVIAIGISFICLTHYRRTPMNSLWAILIVVLMVCAASCSAYGFTKDWEDEGAKREMVEALDTELPETANQAHMQYAKRLAYSTLYISFDAPEDEVRQWIENGVLSFKTDLDDFYTGDELMASDNDMEEAIIHHGTGNVADIYSLVYSWDARLMRQFKIEQTARQYGDICGITTPSHPPYFIWITEKENGGMNVQILSQR
jgi:hypothetical protein